MNKSYDVMVTTFSSMKKREMMTELFWEFVNDFFGDIPTDSYIGL